MTQPNQTQYALETALATFRLIVASPLYDRAIQGLPIPSIAEMGEMDEKKWKMHEQAVRCWTAIQALRQALAALELAGEV